MIAHQKELLVGINLVVIGKAKIVSTNFMNFMDELMDVAEECFPSAEVRDKEFSEGIYLQIKRRLYLHVTYRESSTYGAKVTLSIRNTR